MLCNICKDIFMNQIQHISPRCIYNWQFAGSLILLFSKINPSCIKDNNSCSIFAFLLNKKEPYSIRRTLGYARRISPLEVVKRRDCYIWFRLSGELLCKRTPLQIKGIYAAKTISIYASVLYNTYKLYQAGACDSWP